MTSHGQASESNQGTSTRSPSTKNMTKSEIAVWQSKTPNIAEVQARAESGDRKARLFIAACLKYGWHGLPKNKAISDLWKTMR